MGTGCNDSMATCCHEHEWEIILSIIMLLLLGLMIFVFIQLSPPSPKTPTISVESTTVKAYNVTSDNRLLSLISLGVRAYNPNPNDTNYYYVFQHIVVKVTKAGSRDEEDALTAREVLPDFALSQGTSALIHVKAASHGLVALKSETAEEVRAELAAGEGHVDVRLYASLWWLGAVRRDNDVRVTCKDVVVEFSRPTKRVQRVDCKVRWKRD